MILGFCYIIYIQQNFRSFESFINSRDILLALYSKVIFYDRASFKFNKFEINMTDDTVNLSIRYIKFE